MGKKKKKIRELAENGLLIDGAHHKQWYFEQILLALGLDLDEVRKGLLEEGYDYEPGIAP